MIKIEERSFCGRRGDDIYDILCILTGCMRRVKGDGDSSKYIYYIYLYGIAVF